MVFTIDLDLDGYRARLWSGSNLIWWTEGYVHKVDAEHAVALAQQSYNATVVDRAKAA